METIREQHRRALAHCVQVVAGVRESDLLGTTPCRGWDLADLLAHLIGQNEGFAAAVTRAGRGAAGGDVGVEAFAARRYDVERFVESVKRVEEAFGGVSGEERVLLPEVSAEVRFPVEVVIGMHLVDTLVHTWDVAKSLGTNWRPPEEDLVAAALEQALRVPDGERRTRSDAAFAPALPGNDDDDWVRALRYLGRDPG